MSQKDSVNSTPLQSTKFNYQDLENPFDGDLLERKLLAEQLMRYVDRLKIGAVIGVDARWGEGKTWFARHWKMMLEQNNHQVIFLNAFANDYMEDPFLVIASEIANAFEKTNKDKARVIRMMAAKAYQSLLPLLPQLILSMGMVALGAGHLSQTLKNSYDAMKDAADGVSDSVAESLKECIEGKIEDYKTEKQSLESFKQVLQQLSEKLDKPLVFIIDELDRCRPEFSIRLLERIKHFFDIPNIVFVLMLDKPQFIKSIHHFYGFDNQTSESYLDKFINFTLKLQIEEDDSEKKYSNAIKQILTDLGLIDDVIYSNNQIYTDCLVYSLDKNPTLRQLKRILNRFALLNFEDTNCNSFLLGYLFYDDELKTITSESKVSSFFMKKYKDFIDLRYPKNHENLRKLNYRQSSLDSPIDDYHFAEIAILGHFKLNNNSLKQFNVMNEYFERRLNTTKRSGYDNIETRKKLQPPSQQSIQNFHQAWSNYINQGM